MPQVFKLKKGEAVTMPLPDRQLVLRLAQLVEADPATDNAGRNTVAGQLKNPDAEGTDRAIQQISARAVPGRGQSGTCSKHCGSRAVDREWICAPDFKTFARAFRAGKNQIVSTVRTSDTETPVSAAVKLGCGKPYAFLLESMEGGASRGRYSIIGRAPDLIWRCERGGKASINREALKERKIRALRARAA